MKKTLLITATVILALGGTAEAETKSVSIDVTVRVLPIFELTVSGADGGNLEFGDVQKSGSGDVFAESKEMVLTAKSNLGRPYQITQTLSEPLRSDNAETFEEGDLTVRAQNSATQGSVTNGAGVTTTPTTLFTSDSRGKGDTIRASYRLRVKPDQPAGDYKTRLVYTITAG